MGVYLNKESFLKDNEMLGLNLPYSENVGILGEKVRLGNKLFENRLVAQPMEGCDGTTDGEPDVLTKRRYARLARGGAGIIWYEATAVLKEGRANPRQLYITKDNVDAFKRHVAEIKETAYKENGFEPIVIMQATHSGRYSKPNGVPEPMIAYNNPVFEKDNPIPKDKIVTDEYLDIVKEKLAEGAGLAEEAGFDGVDIKCCHRYLNSELLSAYNREGSYGGNLENRTRLLREAVRYSVENTSGDFIVTSRLNVYDGFAYPNGFGVKPDGSLDFDSAVAIWIVKQLYSYGVRLLNITMGNPYFNPHVNRPYAQGGYQPPEHPLEGVARMQNGTAEIKASVPEMLLISSASSYLGVAAPNVEAGFIEQGKFDFAGFGRTGLAYPDFARDITEYGKMQKEKCCICCSKCTQIMRQKGGTPGCVIRDKDVYLPIYNEKCKNI